jgi:hypothetical protein
MHDARGLSIQFRCPGLPVCSTRPREEFHDLPERSIANSLEVFFKDGSQTRLVTRILAAFESGEGLDGRKGEALAEMLVPETPAIAPPVTPSSNGCKESFETEDTWVHP